MEEDEKMETKIEITDCDIETTPTTIQYVSKETELDILTQGNTQNKCSDTVFQNKFNKNFDFEVEPEGEIKTEIIDFDIEMTPTSIQYVDKEIECDILTQLNIKNRSPLILENTLNKNIDFEVEPEGEIKTEIIDIEMTPTTIQYVDKEMEFDILTQSNIKNVKNRNENHDLEKEIKTEITDNYIETNPTTIRDVAKESRINILTQNNTQNKSPVILLNTANKYPDLEVAKKTDLKTEISDPEIENTPTKVPFVTKETEKISLKPKCSESLLECQTCHIGFRSHKNYKKHMLCHIMIPDSGPTCTMCDVIFATERGFIMHCRITHDEFEIKKRKIDSSQKQVEPEIHAHKAKEDIENKLDHNQCVTHDKCINIDLEAHEKNRSTIGEKAFTDRSSLKTDDENPYKCNVCDKQFNQSSKLKEHERIHINERTFKCNICAKGFTASGSLKIHQSIHTGEKPYKCNVCDVGFNRISCWKKHEKKHTVKSKSRKSTSSEAQVKPSPNAVELNDLNLEAQQKDPENNLGEPIQVKQLNIKSTKSEKSLRKCKYNYNKDIKQFQVKPKTGKGTSPIVLIEPLSNAVIRKYIEQLKEKPKTNKPKARRRSKEQEKSLSKVIKVKELKISPAAPQENISISSVEPIQDKQLNIENPEENIRKYKYVVLLKDKSKTRKRTSSKEQEKSLSKGIKAKQLNRSLEAPQEEIENNAGMTIKDRPFKCNFCDKKFKVKGSLKIHQRIHTGERPLECKICGKCYSDPSYFRRHKKLHINKIFYECNLCDKKYSTSFSLKLHKLTHSSERPHKCNICNKAFAASTTLKYHERTHNNDRPHKCHVCDKRYTNTSQLKTHVRTHYDELPYQCEVCDKRFNYKRSLKMHEMTHTGEKPYKCKLCDKRFSGTANLKSHFKIHTGEKPYKCNFCGKRFSHTGNLKTHLRVHNNEKLYQCAVCNKRFNVLGDLKIHLRIHTGERPYKCNTCDKRFAYSVSLRRHEITHTNKIL